MSHPSGEIVAFDYDSCGNSIGETALASDDTRGTVYRRVRSLSVRGQITLQDLGNGITWS